MKKINLGNLNELNGPIPIHEYEKLAAETDKFSKDDINPILFGLYGEVGSIMATSKKYRREQNAYPFYKEAVEEEFGDTLWYFSALCRRLKIDLDQIFKSVFSETGINIISANDQVDASRSDVISPKQMVSLDKLLIEMGYCVGLILKNYNISSVVNQNLTLFVRLYIQAILIIGLNFDKVLKGNLIKTQGRFTNPRKDSLPEFDHGFPKNERLPRHLEIKITQDDSGKAILFWNNEQIGASLTDNIIESDGYRFHDVFHLANAAILHWSPTFRAIIKHKRKSDPIIDEAQDGGRAIAIEEGLSAWLFSYAKDFNYFEGHDNISFDALKTIQKFVLGFEVDKCPLYLWEKAVLDGYAVFRQVKENEGGIISLNLDDRVISYSPLAE